jgi:hypothetical protein
VLGLATTVDIYQLYVPISASSPLGPNRVLKDISLLTVCGNSLLRESSISSISCVPVYAGVASL